MQQDQHSAKNLEDHEIVTFSRLALSLANDYESIYYINTKDDSYVEYGTTGEEKSLTVLSLGDDFFTDVTYNVPKLVYKDDRAAFLGVFKKQGLLDNLRDGRSFMHNYRLIIADKVVYYQLKAIRGSGADSDFIIVGVKNVDKQVRREMLAAAESRIYGEISMALSSRYEVIYYIDTETNRYTQYSSSDDYAKLGVSQKGEDFFSTAMVDIDRYIDPEDRERTKMLVKKETLLEALSRTGAVSFTYRQLLGERSQYVTMTAVRPKNDVNRIIIGVMNVDAQIRREQAAIAESETYSQIINALAEQYEVIYYVNLDTDHYQEFSSSDKYSKLKIGEVGENFFGDTQRNMKRDIFPEDYPIMAKAMEKQQFISDLSETGSTSITYRLMLDGRPQYVSLYAVRPQDDSDHIIIAVANIDEAMQKEFAYQDMANKDSLTGVKNKRAYAQAEAELDDYIAKFTQPPFSVVVCDINGLKEVNDTKGHNAGDAFIRNACSIICNIFKHSPVFRIGGDEFAVIMKGSDYDERTHLMEELNKVLEANKHNGMVILAAGISDFDPDLDMRVQDVFERADNLMYDNKKICKALGNNK